MIRQSYEQVKRYAESLEEKLKSGAGLVLRGQIGTMKTSLAAAVRQSALTKGKSGYFITMPSLLDIMTLKERNPEE